MRPGGRPPHTSSSDAGRLHRRPAPAPAHPHSVETSERIDVLPDAVQVSNRWRLWSNLCGKVLAEVRSHAGCWATVVDPARPAGVREQTTRARWQRVHHLLDQGVGLLECARRLDVALNTVKRYARMKARPRRRRRRTHPPVPQRPQLGGDLWPAPGAARAGSARPARPRSAPAPPTLGDRPAICRTGEPGEGTNWRCAVRSPLSTDVRSLRPTRVPPSLRARQAIGHLSTLRLSALSSRTRRRLRGGRDRAAPGTAAMSGVRPLALDPNTADVRSRGRPASTPPGAVTRPARCQAGVIAFHVSSRW